VFITDLLLPLRYHHLH